MGQTGRCLCGAISYEFDADPLATVICHCDHCQRQSGGAFSLNLVMPKSALDVSGDLATFDDRGRSGDAVYVHRRFCGACGSPIYSELVEPAEIIALKVGTLDDTSGVQPGLQVHCEDRQTWVDLGDIPERADE